MSAHKLVIEFEKESKECIFMEHNQNFPDWNHTKWSYIKH